MSSFGNAAPIVTPEQFRADYPEFASNDTYPESQLAYWLTWATILLNPNRFNEFLTLAGELWAAHNIVEEAVAARTGLIGGIPVATGGIASRSVDGVATTYDMANVAEKDAGDYNMTTYGRRFWKLMNMAGMGPIQVGIGCQPPWAWNGFTGAWPGPPAWPGWFG